MREVYWTQQIPFIWNVYGSVSLEYWNRNLTPLKSTGIVIIFDGQDVLYYLPENQNHIKPVTTAQFEDMSQHCDESEESEDNNFQEYFTWGNPITNKLE